MSMETEDFNANINSGLGDLLQVKIKKIGSADVLVNLITGLGYFPNYYFTLSERRKLVSIFFLLDLLVSQAEKDCLKMLAVCRSLTVKFIRASQDHFLLVTSPSFLIYYMQSLEGLEQKGDTETRAFFDFLVADTNALLSESFSKVLLKPSGSATFFNSILK